MKYIEQCVSDLMKAVREQVDIADAEDLQRWRDQANGMIEKLEDIAKSKLLNRYENQKIETCLTCLISTRNNILSLLEKTGGALGQVIQKTRWDDTESAFDRRIQTGVISNLGHLDAGHFLDDARALFKEKIAEALTRLRMLKVNTTLSAEYLLKTRDTEQVSVKFFNSSSHSITETTDIDSWYDDNVKETILVRMSDFEEVGSGWSLIKVLNLTVHINKFVPLRGSSYIELPADIKAKKACINVQNEDNKCFLWSVLAALHPVEKDAYRPNKYMDHIDTLNLEGIEFPVTLKQIPKFEKQNEISINVYILRKYGNNHKVYPIHLTKFYHEKHVNLLMVESFYIDENEKELSKINEPLEIVTHYVWIKNMSRLVASQITKNEHHIHVCDRCLHYFYKKNKLDNHMVDCVKLNKTVIKLPEGMRCKLKFKNYKHAERIPFVVYADFETLLKPVEDKRIVQEHQAFSAGFYVKCSYDNSKSGYYSHQQLTEGSLTPSQWFIKKLKELTVTVEELLKNPVPMIMTLADKRAHLESKRCSICHVEYTMKDIIVRDHNHLTGK